ncbi:1-phosphatidylinositol-3-phosphate 5-kinase [Agyrium rufum]|nr:1-phosphatidylinositol-3-phosphate 5-kinase [Agyrium rufum]
MAAKSQAGTESPVQAILLPLRMRSRHGSSASLASTQIDKETLSQALDQIHSAASQSETLTTFNEFAPPPPSSSASEPKSLANDIQGGFTGLYSRFKASYGVAKDSGTTSTTIDDGKNRTDDALSVHSSSQASMRVVSPPATRLTFKPPQYASPSASVSSLKAEVEPTRRHSGKAAEILPTKSNLAEHDNSTVLAKAIVQPTRHSRELLSMEDIDLPGTDGAVEQSLEMPVRDHQQPISPRTAAPVTGISSMQASHTVGATNDIERASYSKSKGSHDNVMSADSQTRPPNSRTASSGLTNTSDRAARDLDRRASSHLRNLPSPNSQGQGKDHLRSRLPEFTFSRASSYDTAGASSVSTAQDGKFTTDNVQDFEKRPPLSRPVSKSTATVQASADSRTLNIVLSQTRSRVLSKEYWMRDEGAKDCFYCGETFSTFRRKHHCRTCGQIFDSKCTALIPGKPFGQTGSVRVCKPCENIIYGFDDSSEFSDDGSISGGVRPRHGSSGASDTPSLSPFPANRMSDISETEPMSTLIPDAVPVIAIPATRRFGDELNRRSAVLEINPGSLPTRPGSSRSFKGGPRPSFSAHRRHHSKHLLQRGFRLSPEDNAPFHRKPDEAAKTGNRLPAFHSDNIIDPDLADYLSDENSSGDEQVSIAAALSGDNLAKSADDDRHNFARFLSAGRKGRSRFGDKSVSGVSFSSRDPDSVSITSAKLAPPTRHTKRRNLSVNNNILLRPSPKSHRFSTHIPGSNLHESLSSSALDQEMQQGLHAIRSSAMKGADAPPVELNNASIQHVRKLLRQLLQDAEVPHVGHWEKALVPILLQATDDVNPNIHHGDDIDIRHYVKLKKIPGGRPGDTSYVSGLVFTKNLALKSMPRNISEPNILILTFPVEYARHHQHFMSLEPVIAQEREFLQNLVHRIAALKPQLLLVERNVSGLALELLEAAAIAVAYNVKTSVLEAVSRCTQTRIVSSIDKLAIMPIQHGECSNFSLKTFVYGGRKKTYMYLSGCPKELGCTIVLRGGDPLTLAKVKRITEFMVYIVYNLKLETSLMRDEFALIPSYVESGSMSPDKGKPPLDIFIGLTTSNVSNPRNKFDVQLSGRDAGKEPDVDDSDARHNESSGSQVLPPQLEKLETSGSEDIELLADIPMPTFYGDLVEKHKVKILSASPFVKFMQPYLLMKAREQERRLAYLRRLQDQDDIEEQRKKEDTKPQKFVLIKPEMIHETVRGTSKKVREVLRAVHDAEFDKALHIYQTQKKQWEAYLAGNINLFDPYAHQNIAVLYSVVCTVTSIPCSGPDTLALGFYNEHEVDEDFEADCTLGQYVEDLCLGASKICTANGCERKMYEHHRQYVHGESQLSVFVENYPCRMRGFQNVILMWSVCRICSNETQILPMSENTWKYSFGKYLELSFWSSELHARAGICPHDIHRNHVRYFGFRDMALRIQYDPIKLLEIIVPRTRITWKVANDLRFKNDVFTKAEDRLNRFMLSVKARIKSIKTDTILPEKSEQCREVVEMMMKKANEEHAALLRKLQEKYMDSKYYEIVPLNRAIRYVQEKVAEWDTAFIEFDRDFFLPEKDIRRLATLQLKKIFLDRDDSVTSLTSTQEGTVTPASDEDPNENVASGEIPTIAHQEQEMSPAKTHDVLASVVENHIGSEQEGSNEQGTLPPAAPSASNVELTAQQVAEYEDIRHLDLAIPQRQSDEKGNPLSPVKPPPPPLQLIQQPSSESEVGDEEDDQVTPSADPTGRLELGADLQASPSNEPRVRRRLTKPTPTLHRVQSQPTQAPSEETHGNGENLPVPNQVQSSKIPQARYGDQSPDSGRKPMDKITERLGLRTRKPGTHSMIPRSIAGRKKDSRVSALAKHFEQLSREFERERVKERRQHLAKNKQARGYPMASAKPIVEIYRDFHEAVEEKDPSDEDLLVQDSHGPHDSHSTARVFAENVHSQTSGEGYHAEDTAAEDTAAENTETDDNTQVDESHTGSDVESHHSDDDPLIDDLGELTEKTSLNLSSPSESQLDLKLDLPRHEKTSLMKILTNFWAERSASGWHALEYPLTATEHVFADSDIIVREDEPSSLIAFALGSEDYQAKLRSIHTKCASAANREQHVALDSLSPPSMDDEAELERSLLRPTGTHLKYQFQEGSAKMLCKIFYAEQFDAVRRKCGVADRIVESLSRCLKWDSKGGKTNSVFLKTLDDRLVLKSLSPVETQAFVRFAPAYFRIMSEALFHDLPSVIAKMLGFYQIIIKNPITGIEFSWYLLVMENLFYDRSPNRIFDLKGSMRNRRIQSTGEQNEVLLDENMVEFIYASPLFAREHSKKLLRASVWNDTLFLSRQNVMDYSLMIAIDENRNELVVGIIDCIRTYTWDKKLESWMKDRGKNRPTVTSPREYKSRFREAMGRYVLQAPDCWHQFLPMPPAGAVRFKGKEEILGLDGEHAEQTIGI